MRITYDPIARAAYVYLRDTLVLTTRTITDQVLVDLDADAHAVGIEILFVDMPVVEILQP